MENQRLFLWIAFAMVVFLLYQAWIQDYQIKPAREAERQQQLEQQAAAGDLPIVGEPATARPAGDDDLPDLPAASLPATPAAAPQAVAAENVQRGERIHIVTDVLDIDIDLLGGDLRRVDLPTYPVKKDNPDLPIRLINDAPDENFIIQSGLRAVQGAEPNHTVTFTSEEKEYELADGADTLVVPLSWTGTDGVSARKIYRFKRGSFRIGLDIELQNEGGEAWIGAPYVQMKRNHVSQKRKYTDVDTFSFRGPVFYDGKKYDKISFKELTKESLQESLTGGWMAMIEHHFLAAAVPAAGQDVTYAYRAQTNPDRFLMQAVSPVVEVSAGSSNVFTQDLFVGPKVQAELKQIAPGLELTVDYGWMTIIAQPLFWILSKIQSVVGNWGWSIILMTVLIKLVFYKLSETSGRSMAKMRKLAPRMKQLQERYKDDRQKLSQATMDMYKREKVNPASGCLPMLVQMPVFLALYWVLIESVELRQAPWWGWINDLSSRDPFFILPVLMGAAMFAQFRLNPAPPDPTQAKVMMVMPIIMAGFMAFFPAGLVLYWFVNTLLSWAQQWKINRVIEREGTRA